MNDKTRKTLIRIAHANPDLREQLLPLLQRDGKTARGSVVTSEILKAMTALKQAQGFIHYRLYDRNGSRDMDGNPFLSKEGKAFAQSTSQKLSKAIDALSQMKGLMGELDDVLGYG